MSKFFGRSLKESFIILPRKVATKSASSDIFESFLDSPFSFLTNTVSLLNCSKGFFTFVISLIIEKLPW